MRNKISIFYCALEIFFLCRTANNKYHHKQREKTLISAAFKQKNVFTKLSLILWMLQGSNTFILSDANEKKKKYIKENQSSEILLFFIQHLFVVLDFQLFIFGISRLMNFSCWFICKSAKRANRMKQTIAVKSPLSSFSRRYYWNSMLA